MKVLVDCDGVLANFTKPLLGHITNLSNRHDDPCRDDEITQFDIAAAFSLPPELVYEPVSLAGYCRDLEPYEGAREGLEVLRKNGITVRACTTPFDSDHWAREREKWLVEKMGFNRKDIHQSHYKEDVFGDVLVDDKSSTLVTWGDTWRNSHAIRFDRPWNINDGWKGKSAADWPSLVATILQIKRSR